LQYLIAHSRQNSTIFAPSSGNSNSSGGGSDSNANFWLGSSRTTVAESPAKLGGMLSTIHVSENKAVNVNGSTSGSGKFVTREDLRQVLEACSSILLTATTTNPTQFIQHLLQLADQPGSWLIKTVKFIQNQIEGVEVFVSLALCLFFFFLFSFLFFSFFSSYSSFPLVFCLFFINSLNYI
jgi:hypothetical protein